MYKVVHISTVHKPYDTRIFIKECSSLAGQGYNVYFLVSTNKNEYKDKVNIVALHCFKYKLFRICFAWIPALFSALKLRADIYHFHDPELVFLGFLLSIFGRKVVYDVHEDYELQILNKKYLPFLTRKLVAKLYKLLERILLIKVKLIIAVTPEIEEKYKRFFKNVVTVKNYPLISEFISCRTVFDEKKNEICYVGGITEIRGAYDYVEAVDLLKTIKLNLGGDYNSLKKGLKSQKGWNNTYAYGFVNRDQIRDIFRKSKVGLVVLHPAPNYINSIPVKMLEYMAAGIPVVCSNFPSFKEIVDENNCGFCIEPQRPDLIAEKVDMLINDKALWSKMSKNAIQAVEKKYSWEAEFLNLVTAYKLILK